jgi:hypothetical protein
LLTKLDNLACIFAKFLGQLIAQRFKNFGNGKLFGKSADFFYIYFFLDDISIFFQ